MLTIIALIALGLILLFLEIILPGGILGVAAYLIFLAATYLGYQHSPLAGHLTLTASIFICSFSLYYAFFRFHKTQWGHKLTLFTAPERLELYDAQSKMIGMEGETLCDCRPSGTIIINNKRYNAMSNGEFIKAGSSIEVTGANGNIIIIRQTGQE